MKTKVKRNSPACGFVSVKRGLAVTFICFANALFFGLVTSSHAQQAGFPATASIVIELTVPKGIGSWRINGMDLSLHDGAGWLKSAADKFGGNDPVIIMFNRDVPVGYIADVIEVVKQSHPHVRSYLRGFQIDTPIISVSTDYVPHPSELLPYLRSVQKPEFRFLAPSSDRADLYTPPPKQLLQLQIAKPVQ